MTVGLMSNVIRVLSILLAIAGGALSVALLQGNVPLMIVLILGCLLLLVMGLALAYCIDSVSFLNNQRKSLQQRLSQIEVEFNTIKANSK